MTIQEQRRKAFEEYFAKVYREHLPDKLFLRIGDAYWDGHIRSCWVGWNAALDSVEITLPQEDGMDGHLWAPDVVKAIEAAGLRVKG